MDQCAWPSNLSVENTGIFSVVAEGSHYSADDLTMSELEVTPPMPSPFLEATTEAMAGGIGLLGLADGMGDVLRESSGQISEWSPWQKRGLTDLTITDYGDLVAEMTYVETCARKVGDAIAAILSTGSVPIFFAEDRIHAASAIRAVANRFPELAVVQLSAWPDFLEEVEGDRWHPRCTMARVAERIPAEQITSLGLSTGERAEFEHIRDEIPVHGPVHLSVDLSVIDPRFLPSVTRPCGGGLGLQELVRHLQELSSHRLVSADLTGLSGADRHGLAAMVAREISLVIGS